MDNQHRQIKGYRELSQEEIDLMNEIKQQGVTLGSLVEKLEQMQAKELSALPVDTAMSSHAEFSAALACVREAEEWTREGKMSLKKGLMALTRAVARPTFF